MRRYLTPGRAVLAAVVLLALGLAAVRFAFGLGAVTNLSDRFPWGLWIGFDVMGGVALAAGGFTMAAAVYVFKLERFRPLVRPAILTGFLGYGLVIAALLVDLGRPYRIWHVLIMWQPHSVMFEVAWCVILYTLLLLLEFGQPVLERLKATAMLRATHAALPALVIAGVILSTLHQSSLGSLFLIVPGKLHPLWYTPLLPLLFFVSAAAVGLGMVVVESALSSRAFRRSLEVPLLADVGRAMIAVLTVYLAIKVGDVVIRGAWPLVLQPTVEGILFDVEVGLGVVLPIVLLSANGAGRSAWALVAASALVVGGVVVNRLNVAVTGMLAASGARYVPSWMEVAITLGIVAAGVLAYLVAVELFPVFPKQAEEEAPAARAVRAPALAAPAASGGGA